MPLFDFHCTTCNLTFSKLVRDRKTSSLPCIECSNQAPKKLSIPSAQFSDAKEAPRGESGVYQLDSSLDINIGRDAKNRWEIIKDRNHEKDRLHAEAQKMAGIPDAKMALKKDFVTGEYQPMTVDEVRANVQLRQEYRLQDKEGLVRDTSKIPSKA